MADEMNILFNRWKKNPSWAASRQLTDVFIAVTSGVSGVFMQMRVPKFGGLLKTPGTKNS